MFIFDSGNNIYLNSNASLHTSKTFSNTKCNIYLTFILLYFNIKEEVIIWLEILR